MKKKIFAIALIALLLICLCACNEKLSPVSTDVDFANSPYKHINNGGVTEDPTLPYNIDAITGATLTVEGPAVVSSTPLSVREVENLKSGIVRGQYKDKTGVHTYEGLDLYYLLYSMVDGDNGIILTDTAYKVVLKNANREDVAVLTLEEIKAAHDAGRPAVLSYGIGSKDGTTVAPYVFDGVNSSTHSLGYVDSLKNDDGCIKLVYDNKTYGDGSYKEFSNVAYVYVCEESEPGFKHTGEDKDGYSSSRYTDYIITFTGSGLGHEINLTVEQLEALVTYDKNGKIVSGGIGYSDWYSLANNAYWYVNEYEGLQLYELLQYLGMPSADAMTKGQRRSTIVKFLAADGVAASEAFSVEALSMPELYGYYKKNAQDPGDGTYVPQASDLVKLGYPVLLSYGVNNYPYVIQKTDEAYVSGLSNSGGPVRVVFGKTMYAHPNGSNQVQYLDTILVGDEVHYNTHKYTDNKDQAALANNTIKVKVVNSDGTVLTNKEVTVGEIEDLIYGENVKKADKTAAKKKDSYEIAGETNIYEGVDIEYFLMNYIGLQGMNGTVTIKGDGKEITIAIEDLFKDGYNSALGRDGQSAIIAFAKNGSPLVQKNGAGYVESIKLNPYLSTDPATYKVENYGGALELIIPSTSLDKEDSQYIENIESIEVNLIPDSYAHIANDVKSYQSNTVKFYGPGLEKEAIYTVADIESKQTLVKTLDFSMMSKSGELTEARYRGISVYTLFKEIGINNNAGDVTVYCADGSSQTYSLVTLKKSYENFVNGNKDKVYAMLAYGTGDVNGDKMDGTPLTSANGGPLMLIVPQDAADAQNKGLCMKQVEAIYVDANEVNTWSHVMSDVFSEFLDAKLVISFKNEDHETNVELTVAQLEAMEDIIVRNKYTVLDLGECEGVELWKLLKKVAGDDIDLTKAISINAIATDGYANDLLANTSLSALQNGVEAQVGDNLPIIVCYAIKGYPLVDTENHEGYTGLAGNCDGPLRVVVEGFQGGSIKYLGKITVTLPGSGEIKLTGLYDGGGPLV